MRLIASGVNHKTAPVEVREKLALHPDRQTEVLRELVALPDCAESLILSTCNRFELYVVESVCRTGLEPADLVSMATQMDASEARAHLYTHEGPRAARHLFEVASGADSMVLGETEIMGQVKSAVDIARSADTVGTVLSRLVDTALATGKRARTETAIDQGNASVASVAVSLSRQICGDPRKTTALLLGAGEQAELTLQRLIDVGVERFLIANRTVHRAKRLAATCNGTVVDFAGIYDVMPEVDVVIASTSAPHAMVHAEPMQQVVRDRGARPLFLIDLAVPRDVEPEVEELDNVFLYNIDSLQEAVQEALESRQAELPKVVDLCEEAAGEFWGWASSLDLVPTMLELRNKAEALREREFERALDSMGDLSSKQRKQLHLLTKRIVQGLVDEPLGRLRSQACEGDGAAYLKVLRELYGLAGEETPSAVEAPKVANEAERAEGGA